jgi:hypothetical protein
MFRLEIDTDNDAFYPWTTEVARLLRKAAQDIAENGTTEGYFRDANGNTCGSYKYEE